MKILILITLLLAVSQQSSILNTLQYYKDEGYDVLEQSFGQFQIKISEELTHIIDTGMNIYNSPNLLMSFQEQIDKISKDDIQDAVLHCSKGKEANVFKWLAWNTGIVGNNGDSQTIQLETNEDTCFKNIEVTYNKTSKNSYTLDFVASGSQGGATCSNIIQFATAETMHLPIIMTFATKKHSVVVENQTDAQMESVKYFGIHIFQTCDKLANLIPDILMTAKLFIGGLSDDPNGEGIWSSKPTAEQVAANLNFIKDGTTYQWEKRNDIFVDLDEHQIQNGDFIIITRFDGVDNLISWGAGGQVGHTCIVLEIEGEMMVVESQDGWYWPKHGIQRNTWAQWKEWAQNADFNVAILPLKEEYRQTFESNLDKAVEFFKSMEGLPYGYHNFLFGWLDDVPRNIPPIATFDYIFIIFTQLENIIPDVVTSFMGEALNQRLGTKGLSLSQCANTAAQRGMDIYELFSIPEQDSWVYSDGASMVCSSFVTAVLRAGGVFGDIEIQATEFTPRDVYQLNIWDTNAKRPRECQAADPDLPYCQIMGKYKMNITQDKWSTVQPYSNMYERCPSETPLFERDTSYPNGC